MNLRRDIKNASKIRTFAFFQNKGCRKKLYESGSDVERELEREVRKGTEREQGRRKDTEEYEDCTNEFRQEKGQCTNVKNVFVLHSHG